MYAFKEVLAELIIIMTKPTGINKHAWLMVF